MVMTQETPKPRSARRRARKPDGTYKGDNPATPEINEAWEPVEAEVALPKKNKYEVKPKVKPQGNAGKYSKKSEVRPTFGKVTRTTY